MKLHHPLSGSVFLLALVLLCGCPGSMSVQEINPSDDDDSQAPDDDDTIASDDDDITPSDDDDDTQTGDDDDTQSGDDDDTGNNGPIAECGPFIVPEGNFPEGSVHYSGEVDADRPEPGKPRIWAGCEVRRYFDAGHNYQCQIYWSINGEREEWSDPCSVYETEASYIPEYSDCSPTELGNDDYFLDDFDWHFATEYHWTADPTSLSLWSAPGNTDSEVPGGPPGGQCGFNGPQGSNWSPWDQNIPFTNWGGDDEWKHLRFEYSTDFRPAD